MLLIVDDKESIIEVLSSFFLYFALVFILRKSCDSDEISVVFFNHQHSTITFIKKKLSLMVYRRYFLLLIVKKANTTNFFVFFFMRHHFFFGWLVELPCLRHALTASSGM